MTIDYESLHLYTCLMYSILYARIAIIIPVQCIMSVFHVFGLAPEY